MTEIIGTIDDSRFLRRAVSKEVNEVLKVLLLEKNQKEARFNLGLFARKWPVFVLNAINKEKNWSCASNSTNHWTEEKPGKEKEETRKVMEASNNLNAIKQCFQMTPSFPLAKQEAENALSQIHKRQKRIMESYRQLGYECHLFSMTMQSPLVHGLGETHPMEKFLTFDRNTGIPYIPSTSVKGVLKTRLMIQELNKRSLNPDDGYLEAKEQNFLVEDKAAKNKEDKILVNENYPLFKELFGGAEEQGKGESQAQQGKIIFLDTFPATFPRLKKEIMTPHYSKYYSGKGQIGPTESQQPVPNAYLSVDPQDGQQKMEFVFLIHPELSQEHPDCVEKFMRVFENEDVSDIGFGSKSAIGFGQFAPISLQKWKEEKEKLKANELQEAERKEKEARLAAEAKTQEEKMAQMSPVERLIEALKTIPQYKDRFHELEKFEGGDKIKLARFFKEVFMENQEWDVKPKRKKQFDKVQKIRGILGE